MKDFLKKKALPLLSLLISVITLLLFWCRLEPFTWDSFGATTAVMGVIVTFLVGFQIWAVIDTSRFKAEIKAEQKEIKSCFEEKQRLIEDKLKYIVLKQKDSDYTYSYYFAKIYGQSLNLPEYVRYSLQAVYYGLQCNAKQYTEACNELIKGVNSVIFITQGLTVT